MKVEEREPGAGGAADDVVGFTGVDWSAAVVDALVIGAALGALVVSVVLNVRDMRRAGSAGRDG